jgi:hypothetical protein
MEFLISTYNPNKSTSSKLYGIPVDIAEWDKEQHDDLLVKMESFNLSFQSEINLNDSLSIQCVGYNNNNKMTYLLKI